MKRTKTSLWTGALLILGAGLSSAQVNPLLIANVYASPPEVKGGPAPRLPDGKPDLQGVWLQRTTGATSMASIEAVPAKGNAPARKGIIVDPPDGRIPYQPWAREKQIDLEEHHMIEESDAHCFTGGSPHQMYTPFSMRILQPPGEVVFAWEYMHAYKIVPLDGRPHIDPKIKLFMGDNRGSWDGDTLVIDVTNQVGRTWFDEQANFHSDAIHVVERITPIDSNNLSYEATIEDPKVYTQPWKIKYFYSKLPDPKFEQMEYSCFEGEIDLTKH